MGRFRRRALTYGCTRETRSRYKIGKVRERSSNGVMDEGSGKIQEASAHVVSSIMVNGAVVEGHITAVDAEASTLPNEEGTRQGKFIQRGDGRSFGEGSEGERSPCSAQTRYTIGKVTERSSNGVMEEHSGKAQAEHSQCGPW